MPKRLLDDEDRLIRGSSEPTREQTRTEREPLSWRDRDKRKDRSTQTPSENRGPSRVGSTDRIHQEQQRKNNLMAANALFANPARESMDKKLLSASGEGVREAGDQYIQLHGYPTSFDLLARLVEHPNCEVLKTTLEKLEPLLATQPAPRVQALLQTLKLISVRARDPLTRRAATGFIRKLNTADVQT